MSKKRKAGNPRLVENEDTDRVTGWIPASLKLWVEGRAAKKTKGNVSKYIRSLIEADKSGNRKARA